MYMTFDTFGKGTLFNEQITQKDDIAMVEKLGWRAVSGTEESVIFVHFETHSHTCAKKT